MRKGSVMFVLFVFLASTAWGMVAAVGSPSVGTTSDDSLSADIPVLTAGSDSLDASTWTNPGPTGAPKARWAYGMSYDPNIKKTVLFGGNATPTTFPSDTWTYDVQSNKWTDVSPQNSPPGRCHPAMAYDAKSKKHVLFGGRNDRFAIIGDTWVYDAVANTWTNPNPSPAPPPTYHPAMAADPVSGKVIFYGGCVNGVGTLSCQQLSDQTWVYDPSANTWTDMKPTTAPPPRDRHQMAYDPVHKKALLFGGVGAGSKVDMADTWLYDLSNNSWEKVTPTTVPAGRNMNPMDFDQTRQMIIMFGGYSSYKDTWYFDMAKKDWVKEATTGAPSGRFGHQVAYDASAQKTITFGGWAGSCCIGDTWVYDSGGRVPVPPVVTTTSPPSGAANVDVKSNVVVNFDLDMDAAATAAAFSITPTVAGGNATVSGKVLTWTHSSNMAPTTVYQVSVAKTAKSTAGDEMTAPHSFSFTTAAGNVSSPPKVASTDPVNGATSVAVDKKITVVFDKQMEAASVAAAFSLTPGIAGMISWDGAGSTMTYIPSATLAHDTPHTATVAGTAKSADGIALWNPHTFTFTTIAKGDDTPPAIVHQQVTNADELAFVTITATITDDSSISQAKVFYRAPAGAWKEVAMAGGLARKHDCHNEVSVECNPRSMAYATEAEMAVYEAVLPNGDILPPKVEYYIEAEDSAGNIASHPAMAAKQPHIITVKKKDGGGGNQTGTGIGGFLTSPLGVVLLIGVIAAIAATVALLLLARRRKRPPTDAYPGNQPFGQQPAYPGYGAEPAQQSPGWQQQGWSP